MKAWLLFVALILSQVVIYIQAQDLGHQSRLIADLRTGAAELIAADNQLKEADKALAAENAELKVNSDGLMKSALHLQSACTDLQNANHQLRATLGGGRWTMNGEEVRK